MSSAFYVNPMSTKTRKDQDFMTTKNEVSTGNDWCRGPESNRYGRLSPQDFKSFNYFLKNIKKTTICSESLGFPQSLFFLLVQNFMGYFNSMSTLCQPNILKRI